MKNITISMKFAFGIIGTILGLIALYTAYRIGEINGAAHCYTFQQTPSENPIRVPLFVNPEDVKYERRFHFTFDPPDILQEYRRAEQLDELMKNCSDTLQKTIALLNWTRSQWEPGRPNPYPPINAPIILQAIRSGRTGGFCAQYNYVFVQALQSFGIRARYVTIRDHEVTEVWLEEFEKWGCFDPYYNAYYTDANQIPLSVYEIYTLVKDQKTPQIAGQHTIENISAHFQKFKTFAVWLKNNHISSPINFQDISFYKVHFVETPEDILQLPPGSLVTFASTDFYFNPNE